MSIGTNRAGRAVRLSLKGAMTLGYGSGSLRRAVDKAVRDGASRVEIDASGVRFLDAAGLGELVACRTIVENAGAEFRLCGAVGKARELLSMTGLDRALMRQPSDGTIHVMKFRVA